MDVEFCSAAPSTLTPLNTWTLSAFFACSYVGSLYVAKSGRLAFHAPPVNVPNGQERVRQANERWRNDPSVIKARLIAVSISTAISCGVIGWTVSNLGRCGSSVDSVLKETVNVLGFVSGNGGHAWSLLRPHFLTPLLYIGPLYMMFLESTLPLQANWNFKRDVVNKFTSWEGIRNYSLAPITEEIVFRACIVSIMKLSGASLSRTVFLAPLWFGIAHAHHAWELYNIYGKSRSALKRAILTCAMQLTYTTLFGWFTTFLFARTGSIYPPITSHIFCNVMGLPNPGYGARSFPSRAFVIYALHVLGIVGFGCLLWPWTA